MVFSFKPSLDFNLTRDMASELVNVLHYCSNDPLFREFGILKFRPDFPVAEFIGYNYRLDRAKATLNRAFMQTFSSNEDRSFVQMTLQAFSQKCTLDEFFRNHSQRWYFHNDVVSLWDHHIGLNSTFRTIYASDLDMSLTRYSPFCSMPDILKDCGMKHTDLGKNIPGITRPYVYVGQPLSHSTFHAEDGLTGSLNINLDGHDKIWFGAGERHFKTIGKYLQAKIPNPCCKNAWRAKSVCLTLKDLEILTDKGVIFYRACQRPGDVILTLPKAIHGVWNKGE